MSATDIKVDKDGRSLDWLDYDPEIHAQVCRELDFEAEVARLVKLDEGE